jgi:hypothetical protein
MDGKMPTYRTGPQQRGYIYTVVNAALRAGPKLFAAKGEWMVLNNDRP